MSLDRDHLRLGAVALAGVAAAIGAPRLLKLGRDVVAAGGLGGTYRDHVHHGPRPRVDPARGRAA